MQSPDSGPAVAAGRALKFSGEWLRRRTSEMRIGASRLRWPALGPVAIGAAVLVG